MAVRGQPNRSSVTIVSIGSEVQSTELTLVITAGAGGTQRQVMVPLTFTWNQQVDGFTAGDIRPPVWFDANGNAGTLTGFTGADGDSMFSAPLTLPDDSTGQVDIIVNANVATATNDSTLSGPPQNVVLTVVYDTEARTPVVPTVDIVDPEILPWRATELPLVIRWSEDVTGFALTSIGSDVGVLSDLVEVEADEYTVLLTLPANANGDVTITITEESAQGRLALGPASDYSETFAYDTRATDQAIANSMTLCEETYDFADNPHFTGAFVNVLEMLVHSGYVYFIVGFIRDHGSMPTNFLNWTQRGASALFRVAVSGGMCERLEAFEDILAGARSLCVFNNEVYYFRGSHYLYHFENEAGPDTNPDWRQQVGEIWKLENGTMSVLVAKTGRTGQEQLARPGDDDYNPYYSIRGGTVSPLVATSDELFNVAGFGDTRQLGANLIADKDVDDIRNWQLSKLTETLETRLPVLETNGHPGWDNVRELAQVTRSRVGYRGDQFVFEPNTPLTAKLDAAITDTATTLPLKDISASGIPSSGTVFIQGELITYTGTMGDALTGLTRGAFETTADGYAEDDLVVFVDHRISEYLSLSLSNDPSRIYNDVKITYGDGQEFTVKDDASIDAYGRRELSLTVPIGAEQTAWVEYLAASYLSDFKDPETVVSVAIEMDTDIEVGDVCFLRQVDRAHLFDCGEVKEVKHDISGRGENQSQITSLKLAMIR